MKKQLVSTILICALPVFFTACVSSVLQGPSPTFSKEISVPAPPNPFSSNAKSVFPSWKNKKSGNVISIVSDCDPNSSATLSSLHNIVEEPLIEVKVIKEENTTFQNKPAVLKKVTAQLDGHPIEIHSLSFKRKSCGYVSSLSGKVGNLNSDTKAFDQFNSGLKFE